MAKITNDFYCDFVLNGKIVVERVHETANVLAFRHTRPFWPVHIVVIPKRHIASLTALMKEDDGLALELLDVVKLIADRVVKENGAARVLTNLGYYQESKHLHFHINSGEQSRPDGS